MFCPYCGNKLKDNGKFCAYCGAEISDGRQDYEQMKPMQNSRQERVQQERVQQDPTQNSRQERVQPKPTQNSAKEVDSDIDVMRRSCSRVGIAVLADTIAVEVVGRIALAVLPDAWLGNYSFLNLLNEILYYVFGAGALWLIIRSMPCKIPPKRSVSSGQLGKWFLENIGIGCALSFFTTYVVMEFITMLTGQSTTGYTGFDEYVPLVVSFFFSVIVAPICEEIIYRQILLRHLLPLGDAFAIVISALAFGLGHANLNQFFYTTALGLLYGLIIVRTGKIQYTIVLHMVTNAWGMLIDPLSAVSEALSGIYAVLVMVCMVIGVILTLKDILAILRGRSVLPDSSPVKGNWKAALTSPGMWASWVILAVLSVYNCL